MVPRRGIKKQNIVKNNNYSNLSLNDVLCPICRSILIEPVTLPCNHGFCSACFNNTMANTNLVCPLCRVRVGSWLRASKKENKLINSSLWAAIQKHFPQQVKNKLEGVDEAVEEVPIRITSKPGEIRREYEAQRVIEEEELRKRQENETRASELLIQKLKEEEELERSIIEEKLKKDEQVAKKLAEELCFDPGPSTSTIEPERSPKKRGPLDTFLRNMANKQLSVSLKPLADEKCDNYRKKESTTKVLFQDKSASLIKNNNDTITFSKLNKIVSERQSLDSNDAITSECIYFKPIEQKKIPPSKTVQILRVPAVAASSSSTTFRAPCGHVEFNHSTLLSPFVRLYNSATLLTLSSSSKTGFLSGKRSNSSCEKEESQDDKESTPTEKKARIQSNSRQTRSMTKTNPGFVPVNLCKNIEKRKSPLKNVKTSPRKTWNKCNELFENEEKKDKKISNSEFDRSCGSPFLGFEKNYKFSLKGRNGVKNLNTVFDNFNGNNMSFKDDNLSKASLDEKICSHRNGEYKSENAEKLDRTNGISLNNIELVIGAKCLRSDSNKRKLQEEEDLKLARKLHEELNCVKYPTRNSISHVSKKFPAPRRQITLYKFLEK